MPKRSTDSAAHASLTAVDLAIRAGRDANGRILPGSTTVRTHFRPDTPCEGYLCTNIVPAELAVGAKKRFFCSPACATTFHCNRYVVGVCNYCGGEIRSSSKVADAVRYCSREHQQAHLADALYLPTGSYRPLIENYLSKTGRYRKNTLSAVKVSLIHFFGHVFTIEGVTELNQITCHMVTRFGAAERARGMTAGNYMGHISTFFKTLMAEDEAFTARNPVIPYIHSQKSNPGVARPFSDTDLDAIWSFVKDSRRTMLMLAVAIGEECGLRIGEVCNIRLEDVDPVKQTIFVRLPTKNMDVRTVPYHDKVSMYLELWLRERDINCTHDRLLHSQFLAFHSTGSLNTQFRNLFKKEKAPLRGFSFHRLRHTWATRLMKNGMELAVLKELGGWKSWNSMQRYIKVLPDTIRLQNEEAYRQIQESPKTDSSETFSLMDFAAMVAPGGAVTPHTSA